MWPVLVDERPAGIVVQMTEAAQFHKHIVAMNESLLLSSLRQHELTEAAEISNAQLQTEIIERKQAEMVSKRLAAIVNFSDDAIISKDMNGIITSWNKGAAMIFGYTADEIVGTSIMRLIPDDRRDEEKQILGRIRRGESVRHFETMRKTKDGRLINVSVTASPIKDATGRIIGASKVARDISERKQAEEMLRRNEALFSTLIEQAPIGVYVVNARFCLQQVNPTALHVFNSVTPLIGRDFSEIVHLIWPKRAAGQIVALFRHTLETGEPYQSSEFAERRRDIGVKEFYEWQIQRVTLPAGEHGVVCFFNNITERKRIEGSQRRLDVMTASNAKLNQEIVRRQAVENALTKSEQRALRLLEQSRELQKKLRNVSHQILQAQENLRKEISHELHEKISQVLLGINVHLGIFTKAAETNPQGIRRTIAPLRRLVEKSVRTVHQFSAELRPSMLDDLGLIPALRAYINEFPKRKGRTIEFSAFAGIETLDTDKRTMLYRVAQEALINIAKHAQASVVKVVFSKIQDGVCLEIIDNGKAFQVNRIASPRWANRLGLTGMRERVEMVGGQFSVESVPGTGTIIRAVIPFRKGKKRK